MRLFRLRRRLAAGLEVESRHIALLAARLGLVRTLPELWSLIQDLDDWGHLPDAWVSVRDSMETRLG